MKPAPSISDLHKLERLLHERRETVEAKIETLLGRSEDECRLALKEDVFGPDEAAMLANLDEGFASEFHELRRDLAAIEAALARLAVKTYGLCATCGSTIAADRLMTHPVAVHCESCEPVGEAPAPSKVA